jgi:hypothetical protein
MVIFNCCIWILKEFLLTPSLRIIGGASSLVLRLVSFLLLLPIIYPNLQILLLMMFVCTFLVQFSLSFSQLSCSFFFSLGWQHQS